jgi:DNA-binding NtrC family response regulator
MEHTWPENLSELQTAIKTFVAIEDQSISLAVIKGGSLDGEGEWASQASVSQGSSPGRIVADRTSTDRGGSACHRRQSQTRRG